MINLNKVDIVGYVIKIGNEYFKEENTLVKNIEEATSCIDEDTCRDIIEIFQLKKCDIKKVIYQTTENNYKCILVN